MSDLYNEQDNLNEETNQNSEPQSAQEPGEEYRKAPYMREGGENRYAYDAENRTRYADSGNGGSKKHGKIAAAVIIAAIALGGVVGFTCWKVGSFVGMAGAASNRSVIETAAPEEIASAKTATQAPEQEPAGAAAETGTEESAAAGTTEALAETTLAGTEAAAAEAEEAAAAVTTAAPETSAPAVTADAAETGTEAAMADTAETGEEVATADAAEAGAESLTADAAEAGAENMTAGAAETGAESLMAGVAETGAAIMTTETAETAAAEENDSDSQTAGDAQVALGGGESQIETAELGDPAKAVKALDVTEVVEVAMPSVVAITTTAVYESYNNNSFDPFYYYFYGGYGNGYGFDNGGSNQYQVTGAGSGIIIGDNGEELWIVTNNHVVSGAETLTVTFSDDTSANAYVKGTDSGNDLAVVGVNLADLSDETKKAIRAVKMGDSDSLKLGETVIAIGNALGLGQSVSTGVVSAVNREITTSEGTKLTTIQTDAAINPGNSGGALLDAAGELIGINVAKDAETDVEGMGYAIPISSAKSIIERLTVTREAVSEDEYPYMGVQLQDIGSDVASAYRMPQGILVYSIEDGSPAQEAGMLPQDIITGLNGYTVLTYDALTEELQYYAGGTEVTVTIQRLESGAYTEKELTMKLGFRKDFVSQQPGAQAPAGQSGEGGQAEDGQKGDERQQPGKGQNGFSFGN